MIRLEIKNQNKLKYKRIIKYKNITNKINQTFDKALEFINKSDNIKYALLYKEAYWLFTKKENTAIGEIEIYYDNSIDKSINKSYIRINDIKYPILINFHYFEKEYNLNRSNILFMQYIWNERFKELKYDKIKQNINYLSCQSNYGYSIAFNKSMKEVLNIKNIFNYNLVYKDTKKKYDIKYLPYTIYSNFNNFDKLDLRGVKFDLGILNIIKYQMDKMNINNKKMEKIYLKRLCQLLNFILKHSNKNASYLICCIRFNPRNTRFENIICKLSLYFKEIILHKEPTDTSVSELNFCIYLKRFKDNNTKINEINFLDKEEYNCINSIDIKKNINIFMDKLIIEYINFYNYLKSFKFKEFNFHLFKNKIIDYMIKYNFSINIYMNRIIKEEQICNYEDMSVFIDYIKKFNIKRIVEKDMIINNFLYITYLYNQQNNKLIHYNIINPRIDKNKYMNIISDFYLEESVQKFKIDYSKSIKKNDLIIYNKDYNKENNVEYIIVPINTELDFINDYYIWTRSKNYLFLIKIKLFKKVK